jgi:hypothetical protein
MLHLEFVDDLDFYEKDAFTMHDETFFRMELCSDMENYYYKFGTLYLRSEEVAKFLKDNYDIRWIDDFTIDLPNGDGSFTPAPPTAMPIEAQICLQIIKCSVMGMKKRLVAYDTICSYDKLVWMSENCGNDLYIVLKPKVVIPTEGCTMLQEKDVIDFIYMGSHYNSSYVDFQRKLKRARNEKGLMKC